MNTGTVIWVLVMSGFLGWVGWNIGTRRGRPVLGASLGFLLGLVGLGILLLVPRTAEAKARRAAAAQAPQPEQVYDVGAGTGLRPPGSGPDAA